MDEIDDAELLELAEADMSQPIIASQEQPGLQHQQPQQTMQAPHEGSQNNQSHTDRRRLGQGPAGPEDNILLQDHELIELESTSREQTSSRSDQAEDPASRIRDSSAAPLTETLDDEDLLALATTQLDEA